MVRKAALDEQSAACALGVNIDHVATLRQARRGALSRTRCTPRSLAEQAGADSITLHLREDRRHIQDRDVRALRGLLQTHMNLEMAVTDEMLAHRRRRAAGGLLPGARAARGGHDRGRPRRRRPDATRLREACAAA